MSTIEQVNILMQEYTNIKAKNTDNYLKSYIASLFDEHDYGYVRGIFLEFLYRHCDLSKQLLHWDVTVRRFVFCPEFYFVRLHINTNKYSKHKDNKRFIFEYYIIPTYDSYGRVTHKSVDYETFLHHANIAKAENERDNGVHVAKVRTLLEHAENFVNNIKKEVLAYKDDFTKFRDFIKSLMNTYEIDKRFIYDEDVTYIFGKVNSIESFLNTDYVPIIKEQVDLQNLNYNDFQTQFLINLVMIYKSISLNLVRSTLLEQYNTEGILYIVRDIKIDPQINLGVANRSIKRLISDSSHAYVSVITTYFTSVTNADHLDVYIKQLLRLLYDINNVSDRNIKFVEQFILSLGYSKAQLRDLFPDNVFGWHERTTGEGGSSSSSKSVKVKEGEYHIRKLARMINNSYINSKGERVYLRSTAEYGPELLARLNIVKDIFNEQAEDSPNVPTRIANIDFGPKNKTFIIDFITARYDDQDITEITGKRINKFAELFNYRANNDKNDNRDNSIYAEIEWDDTIYFRYFDVD